MRFTIERSTLLRSLAHIQSVVEKRNTIPILSNVQLIAERDGLRLSATDLELLVVETIPADVATPGGTTVPAHMLYDIVRKLPDGSQVELHGEGEDERITVRCGRSSFKLSCLPMDDFPVMGEGDLPHQFRLACADMKRLIEKTRFAISTEETRYYLNGIYLHAVESEDGKCLRAVATDGHRLAKIDLDLPDGADGMDGVIVPRKAVQEVHKLLEDDEADLEIGLSDSKIRFTCGALVLISKLIDGTFPDYERVIPTDNDRVLDVDRQLFTDAVDRVSTISAEKTRAVKMTVEPERLTLSANSPEHGDAVEEVAADFEGQKLEIGFNARYLLDITQQIASENARFLLADAAAPTLIRDTSDQRAVYVLMPMRV